MLDINKLRVIYIEALERNGDLDSPFLISRGKKWTRREVMDEVNNQTEFGDSMLEDILKLAIHMMERDKSR